MFLSLTLFLRSLLGLALFCSNFLVGDSLFESSKASFVLQTLRAVLSSVRRIAFVSMRPRGGCGGVFVGVRGRFSATVHEEAVLFQGFAPFFSFRSLKCCGVNHFGCSFRDGMYYFWEGLIRHFLVEGMEM